MENKIIAKIEIVNDEGFYKVKEGYMSPDQTKSLSHTERELADELMSINMEAVKGFRSKHYNRKQDNV